MFGAVHSSVWESDIPENCACPTIQLVGLHSYNGPGSFAPKSPAALARAIASQQKFVMVEEFGASGRNKAEIVREHIDIFNRQLRIPWSIWEISKPGTGAADFEFFVGELMYDVVVNGSCTSLLTTAAQDFSKYFTMWVACR
jgi:mannan endo-1,4-beta-mannosidase